MAVNYLWDNAQDWATNLLGAFDHTGRHDEFADPDPAWSTAVSDPSEWHPAARAPEALSQAAMRLGATERLRVANGRARRDGHRGRFAGARRRLPAVTCWVSGVAAARGVRTGHSGSGQGARR
ncbi:MAG: hypothetical protein ACRDZO_05810 [Egibacteraceae bacterium]